MLSYLIATLVERQDILHGHITPPSSRWFYDVLSVTVYLWICGLVSWSFPPLHYFPKLYQSASHGFYPGLALPINHIFTMAFGAFIWVYPTVHMTYIIHLATLPAVDTLHRYPPLFPRYIVLQIKCQELHLTGTSLVYNIISDNASIHLVWDIIFHSGLSSSWCNIFAKC